MKQWYQQKKSLYAAVLLYFVGVVAYSCYEFVQTHRSGLQQIDEQLLKTVGFAENILRSSLYDNLTGEKPLTPDEDYLLSMKLQDLATHMNVAYIYSMILDSETVFFIASNPVPEDLVQNRYHSFFMTTYDEAPKSVFRAFTQETVQFDEYADRWGEFRSVFFPLKDSQQQTYVIGVDIRTNQIRHIAWLSLLQAVFFGALLGLMVFPLLYLFLRNLHDSYAQQLSSLEHHVLTGLPNQRRLETAVESNEGTGKLLLIDIENFDHVTHMMGVGATDSIVLKLACRLTALKIEGIQHCQWFHLADNRFALFSSHSLSDHQIRQLISASFQSLTSSKLLTDEGEHVPLVIRMGAVNNYHSPLVLANMALIHARETNQSLVVYEPSLNLPGNFRRYITLFSLLSDALKMRRVNVFFQPILDVKSASIVKYEALARLTDGSGEIISSPDEFMPVAYQSRLCHKLTRVVVDKVIEKVKYDSHVVSINFSVKDLFDTKTRDYVIHRLRISNIGRQVELELLEQQMISNYRLAAAYIKQLNSVVSRVGMDDLGRLYSNFDRLFSLPLDFVKIDGAVIEAIHRDNDAKAIVESIVGFARQKGMQIVAEHCHSQSVCDMVVLMGVDLLQGFHIGKPEANFVGASALPQVIKH